MEKYSEDSNKRERGYIWLQIKVQCTLKENQDIRHFSNKVSLLEHLSILLTAQDTGK